MEPTTGVVIVVVVVVIFAGLSISATRAKCREIEQEYQNHPAETVIKYGYRKFAAWNAAQRGWVRFWC